jgi:hypothetical protein
VRFGRVEPVYAVSCSCVGQDNFPSTEITDNGAQLWRCSINKSGDVEHPYNYVHACAAFRITGSSNWDVLFTENSCYHQFNSI